MGSNPFGATNFMEENIIGGRNKCEYCGEMVNNAAYHEAIQCLKRPTVGELSPEESERISKSYRASGYVVCEVCGKPYSSHKLYIPSGKTNHEMPWLNELCNGDLVKL
jgi:formylmethanofuran dehydrogenase subunit E